MVHELFKPVSKFYINLNVIQSPENKSNGGVWSGRTDDDKEELITKKLCNVNRVPHNNQFDWVLGTLESGNKFCRCYIPYGWKNFGEIYSLDDDYCFFTFSNKTYSRLLGSLNKSWFIDGKDGLKEFIKFLTDVISKNR